ncbi:MAG: tetratricopeptide repeat-containing sensor histidine kinase [Mongoliitalea sp.]
MKYLLSLLCAFLLYCPNVLIAQQDPVDSLRQVIATTTSDTIKAEAIMELAWKKMYEDSPQAKSLVFDGLRVMENIDNLRVKGYGFTVAGVVYWVASSYDTATMYLEEAINVYQQKGDDRGLSAVYNNLSLIAQNQSKYPEALAYATRSLELARKLDNPSMLASATFTVGNIHYFLKDNQKALETYLEALRLFQSNSLTNNLHKLLLNIGSTYHNLLQLDSAKFYYTRAFEQASAINDFKTIAITTTNLGNLAMDSQEYSKAVTYYNQAETIYREKFTNDFDHSLLLHSLAKAYWKLDNPSLAENYGRQSLTLGEKIQDKQRSAAAHQLLSEIYESQGRFQQALLHFKSGTALKDSIFNLEKSGQLAEIETKYETALKDQQISEQQLTIVENQKNLQRSLFALLLGGLILLAVSTILLLIRSRNKKEQKLLIQQKELEVKEAYIHAALESQETERKRFAQDLHDGFGQLISALRLNISQLQSNSDQLETRIAVVDKSENILQEMHQEIRNIAFNLMPATLIQFGLKEGLREFAQRMNQSGKISIEVTVFGLEDRLEELLEISLYRVIQEWVNNAIKYASPHKISIQLTRHEEELSLIIEDDGKGFNPHILENASGNGWRNIQSRLQRIGAQWEVDSQADRKGTSFIIDVPSRGVVKAKGNSYSTIATST